MKESSSDQADGLDALAEPGDRRLGARLTVGKEYFADRRAETDIAKRNRLAPATVKGFVEQLIEQRAVSVRIVGGDDQEEYLEQLQQDLLNAYASTSLSRVRLAWGVPAPGAQETSGGESGAASFMNEARVDAVIDEVGRVAGAFLSDELNALPASEARTLVLSAGRGVSSTVRHIRVAEPLHNLIIVPSTGLMGQKRLPTAALSNGRLLERITSGSLQLFPAPGLVSSPTMWGQSKDGESDGRGSIPQEFQGEDPVRLRDFLERMPVVCEALEQIERADIAVISVASEPRSEDWVANGLISQDVLNKYDNEIRPQLKGRFEPCGSVGPVVFNEQGGAIDEDRPPGAGVAYRPLGLKLEHLKAMVKQKKTVLLAVGADTTRARAIDVLIRSGCVSVLATDTEIALELLRIREQPTARRDPRASLLHYLEPSLSEKELRRRQKELEEKLGQVTAERDRLLQSQENPQAERPAAPPAPEEQSGHSSRAAKGRRRKPVP